MGKYVHGNRVEIVVRTGGFWVGHLIVNVPYDAPYLTEYWVAGIKFMLSSHRGNISISTASSGCELTLANGFKSGMFSELIAPPCTTWTAKATAY